MNDFRETLSNYIGRIVIDRIAEQVMQTPVRLTELYQLLDDDDPKVAWRAAWVCEKLCRKLPDFFMPRREELMNRAMQCSHGGQKRLFLNMLNLLPVQIPINIAFLDCCFNIMQSPTESVANQAVSMKLAFALCQEEPELLGELYAYLENMEPCLLTPAVLCTRNKILKKIRQ